MRKMRTTKKYVHEVLFIILHKVVPVLSLWINSSKVTFIQRLLISAVSRRAVRFVMLDEVTQTLYQEQSYTLRSKF